MLLGSLASPASVLLMGVDPADPSGTSFVFDPDENGNPQSLLVFTSPIEIAALDPHVEARSANALDILRYALDIGAPSVKVNAINPSTVLSAARFASSSILCVDRKRSSALLPLVLVHPHSS